MKLYILLMIISMTQVPVEIRDSLIKVVDREYIKEKTEFENRNKKAEYEYKIMTMSMFPVFCLDSSRVIGKIKHGVGTYKDKEGKTHLQIMAVSYVRWLKGIEPDRKMYVAKEYVLEKGVWVKGKEIRVNMVLENKKKIWYKCE